MGVRRTDLLYHPFRAVVGLVLKRCQDTCVTLGACPPQCPGRSLVSEPYCEWERDSDFDSNPLSNRSDTLPHLEKPIFTLMVKNRHVCFEILLHVGEGLAAQRILTVVQKLANGCPRRARTSRGTVDDRVRGRRGGGGILQ